MEYVIRTMRMKINGLIDDNQHQTLAFADNTVILTKKN